MVAIQQFLADRLPVLALAAHQFVADHVPDLDLAKTDMSSVSWGDDFSTWIAEHWKEFLEWASQPYILAIVMAWIITFWVVVLIFLGLGFGPIGIVAGSFAAAFQSYMYGGFTPAGGIFATLTSMAMLGALVPAVLVGAATLSTLVAVIVWLIGVGQ
ncbi:hypothetical protein QBC47DRAFT_392328 [Echria macrotheca]|uniref:Transmembrane protein n=1 Tax=Echria macrotheca TaxID=438768 RepID=A0AAJ0F1F2_9PEZI|nr:hypothetical protein QBC47DRAFT_392328 [Echria macrotheca]